MNTNFPYPLNSFSIKGDYLTAIYGYSPLFVKFQPLLLIHLSKFLGIQFLETNGSQDWLSMIINILHRTNQEIPPQTPCHCIEIFAFPIAEKTRFPIEMQYFHANMHTHAVEIDGPCT